MLQTSGQLVVSFCLPLQALVQLWSTSKFVFSAIILNVVCLVIQECYMSIQISVIVKLDEKIKKILIVSTFSHICLLAFLKSTFNLLFFYMQALFVTVRSSSMSFLHYH